MINHRFVDPILISLTINIVYQCHCVFTCTNGVINIMVKPNYNNDNYHFEELKSPISINNEGGGNGRQIFPQFNSNTKFVRFT